MRSLGFILLLICGSKRSFARVNLSEGLHYKCLQTWKDDIANVQKAVDEKGEALKMANSDIDSFSMCVNPDVDKHPYLDEFKYVFRKLKTFKMHPDKFVGGSYTSNYRILVPDGAQYALRQRIQGHFVWNNAKDYKAVIIIAIKSPLGIPFGQIYPPEESLVCLNPTNWYERFELDNEVTTIPCLYRPKASVMHPNILVLKKRNAGNKFLGQIQFDFKYIDVACHDANAMQYQALLIADYGSDTSDPEFDIAVSFVMLRFKDSTRKDSKDGFPREIFWGWRPKDVKSDSKVTCMPNDDASLISPVCLWNNCQEPGCYCTSFQSSLPSTSKDNANDSPFNHPSDSSLYNTDYLKQNAEYNRCVWDNVGLDPESGECPPGPFACAQDNAKSREEFKKLFPASTTTKGATEFRVEDSYVAHCDHWDKNEVDMDTKCKMKDFQNELRRYCQSVVSKYGWDLITTQKPAIHSNSTLTVKPKPNCTLESKDDFRQFHGRNRRIHGAMMITAYFMVNSLSIFLARFFKETPNASGVGCCEFGRWLFVHVILSFASFYLALGGWVFVGTQRVECDYDRKGRPHCGNPTAAELHRIFGYFVFILPFFNVPLGVIRPWEPGIRNVLVWIHAAFGHIVQFLALGDVILSNARVEIKIVTAAAMGANFVLLLIATFVQMCLDWKMGIRRSIIPVPEALTSTKCLTSQVVLVLIALIVNMALIAILCYLYHKHQAHYVLQLSLHSKLSPLCNEIL